MNHIYLVRHDAEKNMHRSYQLFVSPGLLVSYQPSLYIF